MVTIEMNRADGIPFKNKQGTRTLHSLEEIPADLAVRGISSFLFKLCVYLPDYDNIRMVIALLLLIAVWYCCRLTNYKVSFNLLVINRLCNFRLLQQVEQHLHSNLPNFITR